MSSHPALTRPIPGTLAIDLAQSRVGLAAVRCRHREAAAPCEIDDGDVHQAEILLAHYAFRLKELTENPPSDGLGPGDEFTTALRAVMEQYRATIPKLPLRERESLEELVRLLGRFVDRSLTPDEATAIVMALNQISA